MWPSSNVSSLQKTYDEAYLKCSTAVYYESQGDEKEAMLCWKNALDQIRQTPTNKRQGTYSPKSETERALLESLRELEVQCKERIDLLEALRISREEDPSFQFTQSSVGTEASADGRTNPNTPERGWIGDGTIPAITYTELSKPPLPKRPSFPSRSSSEQAISGLRSAMMEQDPSSATKPPSLPPYGASVPRRRSSRSPSPEKEKHTMRTTLRSGKQDKSSKAHRHTPAKISKGPGASKAATLAWSSLERGTSTEVTNSPSRYSEPRRSYEQVRKSSSSTPRHWDSHTRRLVIPPDASTSAVRSSPEPSMRNSADYSSPTPSSLALGAASSALGALAIQERDEINPTAIRIERRSTPRKATGSSFDEPNSTTARSPGSLEAALRTNSKEASARRKPVDRNRAFEPNSARKRVGQQASDHDGRDEISSSDEQVRAGSSSRKLKGKQKETVVTSDAEDRSSADSVNEEGKRAKNEWESRKKAILKNLPPGIDEGAAKAIFNEIVVHGDEVHWTDVAGLEIAKNALREAVVYPFLRPDLFMGLREPARGMLLFGPPGTGKTMLARAVATESKSTFFSISASSLTSKYLGESEKLVRALFALAKVMAPSIIFVDEIDSLLSQRTGSGEHEATRRIKTEFLIQWSDLQRAAAGRESNNGSNKERGDPNRVLVLAATNLPWAIDEAARRRFVRRQYIPLPEAETRATQLKTLLGQQKHSLTDTDITELVDLTDGFSGSDITALAKDAAMGPLRALGEALLHMTMDQIRPIELVDFKASLKTIRPSVSKEGLKEYEDWARRFGERGG
ncbi:AAA-domain-containing protein [Annulohypoxylon truncatum]|uniref:AAA-domain-containing protein n=1 Tax=Annulohypoxylon truncatum TaxID=327061 RepID=UPI00200737C0|nr:AAA-domain-containing protein [Annulohypoxylon truncatum]KAI1207389.1 AAA-domain-containing protein [Annulohypoxylon truncatum]